IHQILDKFNMTCCNPVATPADAGVRLTKPSALEADALPLRQHPYREAVGSLMYLMVSSGPDIAFSVSKVAQYASNHGAVHWTAVKRIFRYIKATSSYALVLGNTSNIAKVLPDRNQNNNVIILTGACDADWAGDQDDRKSTGGYVFN